MDNKYLRTGDKTNEACNKKYYYFNMDTGTRLQESVKNAFSYVLYYSGLSPNVIRRLEIASLKPSRMIFGKSP